MGLFDKLFGKKTVKEENVVSEQASPAKYDVFVKLSRRKPTKIDVGTPNTLVSGPSGYRLALGRIGYTYDPNRQELFISFYYDDIKWPRDKYSLTRVCWIEGGKNFGQQVQDNDAPLIVFKYPWKLGSGKLKLQLTTFVDKEGGFYAKDDSAASIDHVEFFFRQRA